MTRLERSFGLTDGNGVECNASGVSLAGVALLKVGVWGFEPRPVDELASLLEAAYGQPGDVRALRRGLSAAAKALNEADLGRAMVAAVQLRLPPVSADAVDQLGRTDRALAKFDPSEPRDNRGRWTTGDGGSGASEAHGQGEVRLQPAAYTPTASAHVYPWVTDFRNRRLVEAMRLAAVIGHGATADEVLALSGNEFDYGRKDKATVYGNYFGIHSNGTDPARYLPGQVGTIPTKKDSPLATFAPATGYMISGSIFANRMASHANGLDLSDAHTFFTLANKLGWGSDTPGYVKYMAGVYAVMRRSAETSERRT